MFLVFTQQDMNINALAFRSHLDRGRGPYNYVDSLHQANIMN